MDLEEIKQTTWYKTRPEIIQKAIDLFPPGKMYKLKGTGKQCLLVSYEEPDRGKVEDVTFTVRKTGVGGVMSKLGLSALDSNRVFGVKMTDLEEWIE